MKKITVFIIGLFALLIVNNVSAQEVQLQAQAPGTGTPNWTYFHFSTESGVDLSNATLTVHVVGTKPDGEGSVNITKTMAAYTYFWWTPGYLLEHGWVEAWIQGYGYSAKVYFYGSPNIVPVPISNYIQDALHD